MDLGHSTGIVPEVGIRNEHIVWCIWIYDGNTGHTLVNIGDVICRLSVPSVMAKEALPGRIRIQEQEQPCGTTPAWTNQSPGNLPIRNMSLCTE
jgi:hypothetical protein